MVTVSYSIIYKSGPGIGPCIRRGIVLGIVPGIRPGILAKVFSIQVNEYY